MTNEEFTKAYRDYMDEYRTNEDDISDEEYEAAAQEAHDNLVRSLVEAGGEIREARELLTRLLKMLYLYGYDEFHGSDVVKKNIIDTKEFLARGDDLSDLTTL